MWPTLIKHTKYTYIIYKKQKWTNMKHKSILKALVRIRQFGYPSAFTQYSHLHHLKNNKWMFSFQFIETEKNISPGFCFVLRQKKNANQTRIKMRRRFYESLVPHSKSNSSNGLIKQTEFIVFVLYTILIWKLKQKTVLRIPGFKYIHSRMFAIERTFDSSK